MRILVTGGAGFIGSSYVRMLLGGELEELPSEVTVLDKLTYSGNKENLESYLTDPRLQFIRGDICDEVLVNKLMAGQDLIVHFAAESHVDRSINDGADFVRTNVLGTEILLASAVRNKVKKFLHVSTDEVYGSIEKGYWAEDQPLAPNSPYSASKASADLLVRAYGRTHGLDVRITRCSNNYGSYQFPEKIIPLFITNLLDDKPLPVYGTGLNIREWIHVEDHCRAIQSVINNGEPGEIYNIGGGIELTNLALSVQILKIIHKDSSYLHFVEDRKAHDFRYALDSSKIIQKLGYEPRRSFEEGILDTVRWYRENENWWRPLKKNL
jgi:dTDP-glucose 4,6-dehydratase